MSIWHKFKTEISMKPLRPHPRLLAVMCSKNKNRKHLCTVFFKWFYSKWPMNHKKEVISHHSLPWLPRDCAKMHHTLGFPLHLPVSASVVVKKTASEAEHSPMVIYTVALLAVFVLTSQYSPKQCVAMVLRTLQTKDGSLRPLHFWEEKNLSL